MPVSSQWFDVLVKSHSDHLPRLFGVSLLAIAFLGGCSGSDPQPDRDAARSFFDALGHGDASTAAAQTTDAAAAQASITASLKGLSPGGGTGTFTITGVTNRKNDSSTVAYTAHWALGGVPNPWTYQGTLAMVKPAKVWQVSWAPHDIHPGLGTGQHLRIVRTAATRGDLLDSSGQPLFTQQPVVTVGINPSQVTDVNTLAATLANVLHISAADIVASVKASAPDQFVPVVTLREADYQQIRAQIHELAGTQFQTGNQLLGPSTHFAQPLLGKVGVATQELINASQGKMQAGDQTGLSGLQLALNGKLVGKPGVSIYAADDNATPDAQGGEAVTKLADVTLPSPGTPVQLTLDRKVQAAAEAALSKVVPQASIVVTQPSTGKILAVATSAATQTNIGLDGQFPPGSTFKIATYAAAFTSNPSLTPTTPVACPATITVNGQVVRNENPTNRGTIPISSAFAFSCNTTAGTLGMALPAGALNSAAKSLGLGQKWSLPIDAFSGSLPEPAAGAVNELAADSYGQGKVLVSPLLMAEIAGAATTGAPIAPSIVVGQQATAGGRLPAQVTSNLNALMRDVVTAPGATGRALAGLPGQVQGKTGTAEFGTAVPPQSHSWFAGTRGDLAFSVFIYGGGNSDSATGAVSVTKSLLTALP